MSERLSTDDRYELASVAAAAERRNRPSTLITLGLLLVVVGLAASLIGFVRYQSASDSVEAATRSYARVADDIGAVTRLEELRSRSGADARFEPDPNFQSKIEDLAPLSGLSVPPARVRRAPPREGTARNYFAIRIEYTMDIPADELDELIVWLRSATREIPGTMIEQLKLEPEANTWKVTVAFLRWERRTETM